MKKVCLATALLLLVVLTGVSFAVEVTLYDGDFVRDRGKPVTTAVTFPVVEGPATLKLYVDSKNRKGFRISRARVKINGKVVFRVFNFRRHKGYLEKKVSLISGDNELKVMMFGKPGRKIKVKIVKKVEAEAAALVGPEGGTVEVRDPESPIFGLKINVSPGAIENNYDFISIGYKNELPFPVRRGLYLASKVLTLKKSEDSEFIFPVEITIPCIYASNTLPNAFYWDEDTQQYKTSQVTSYDVPSKKLTFLTTHFTFFAPLSFKPDDLEYPIDTHFRPLLDGFFHPNFGAHSVAGQCSGMSYYSIWYFNNMTDHNRISERLPECQLRTQSGRVYHRLRRV